MFVDASLLKVDTSDSKCPNFIIALVVTYELLYMYFLLNDINSNFYRKLCIANLGIELLQDIRMKVGTLSTALCNANEACLGPLLEKCRV